MPSAQRAVGTDLLKCSEARIKYDYQTKVGQLFMPEGECCDMQGCFSIFEYIDSDVSVITTYSGDDAVTLFFRVVINVVNRHGHDMAAHSITCHFRPILKYVVSATSPE